MKNSVIMSCIVLASISTFAQGYKVGDEAANFKLKNVDGKMVSLSDYSKEKGVVVIFTCNHCPYSVAYEDRIVAIDKEFKTKGYPVIAINPSDPAQYPDDSFENMKVRAKEKGFTFPYVFDEKQEVFPVYGATKTPHVYLLQNKGGKFTVAYIGAIDNSSKDASLATEKYLEGALNNLLADKLPNPAETKAIGCGIKAKK